MWFPEHEGVIGNERADEPAKTGLARPLNGPEPAVRIASFQVKTEIRKWLMDQHHIRYVTSTGMEQTKAFIAGTSKRLEESLLKMENRDLKLVVGLLTGPHLPKKTTTNTRDS